MPCEYDLASRMQGKERTTIAASFEAVILVHHLMTEEVTMYKLKTDTITAIHPDTWPTWAFVSVDDDTYTDNDWQGCDYRVNDPSVNSHNLAVDIFITGRNAKWNGITFETRALIVFPTDGDMDPIKIKGKVYSTAPLTNPNN